MPPIGREVGQGHREVSMSMLPDTVSECPHCQSKDISIVGVYKRHFEQPLVDGKVVPEKLVLGPNAMQEVEGILCRGCNIHTIVEEDEVFERESIIFDLQTQIAALQGRNVVTPTGKEWRN